MKILGKLGLLGIAVLIVLFGINKYFGEIFYHFVAQPVEIAGDAMAPNYKDGQFYLINKTKKNASDMERGLVILYRYTTESGSESTIKRIIALPGDTIKIENGKIFLNDSELMEPYLEKDIQTQAGKFIEEGETLTVPADSYFVMGDNRDHSLDSRSLGFIKLKDIKGTFGPCYNKCN